MENRHGRIGMGEWNRMEYWNIGKGEWNRMEYRNIGMGEWNGVSEWEME